MTKITGYSLTKRNMNKDWSFYWMHTFEFFNAIHSWSHRIYKYYRLNCAPSKFICWSSHSQYFRMWLYLKLRSLDRQIIKIRVLGWALIQYNPCPYKKRKCIQRDTGMNPDQRKMMWGPKEDSYLQAKDTLILDFHPPELLENKFLQFNSPRLR
jgi:hypothetical protein